MINSAFIILYAIVFVIDVSGREFASYMLKKWKLKFTVEVKNNT